MDLRNKLYDSGVKKSYAIPVPSICVGNLSLGGTGKTPMVCHLVDSLEEDLQIQILSRGYGRKTRGYLQLKDGHRAEDVGDEPFMYFNRFAPKIGVHVCEERKFGVEQILDSGKTDLIILDDAFQHRKVKAGLNLVLSEYAKPFFRDYVVPTGRLREFRKGIRRADLLVFSKCPEELTSQDKEHYIRKSGIEAEKVFFSRIRYGDLIHFSGPQVEGVTAALLVSGIADPGPLEAELSKQFMVVTMSFRDHHDFSLPDIERILKKFDTFASGAKVIVTTEKDFVRLIGKEFSEVMSKVPWYYQRMDIELDRPKQFLEIIKHVC